MEKIAMRDDASKRSTGEPEREDSGSVSGPGSGGGEVAALRGAGTAPVIANHERGGVVVRLPLRLFLGTLAPW